MAVTVRQIYEYISSLAPYETQMSWDNSGMNVGDPDAEVKTVVMALDMTNGVIDHAQSVGAELIITHHPSIFSAIKSVTPSLSAYRLIRAGIAAVSAHTNLDASQGGVNDVLCARLGLCGVSPLCVEGEAVPMGRIGTLPSPMSASELALYVRDSIDAGKVSFAGAGEEIKRVAVIGGSGGEYYDVCKAAGADALVTGEAKHHQYLASSDIGLTMIVAGHYETERPVIPALAQKLSAAFAGIKFIVSDADHIIHHC